MLKTLIRGDCLDYLRSGRLRDIDCIFADPPDNLGLGYLDYRDNLPEAAYYDWLELLLHLVLPVTHVFWLSIYHRHLISVLGRFPSLIRRYPRNVRQYIWKYAFGQYRTEDNPSGYRPILRISRLDWKPIMDERVQSVREKMGDLRASGTGRVPDDVWEFSRVQGNSKERRSWHPTQHPEDLYRRIMRMSMPSADGKRVGTFVDLFAGTGTCFRAAWDDMQIIGIELSGGYCDELEREHGIRRQDF